MDKTTSWLLLLSIINSCYKQIDAGYCSRAYSCSNSCYKTAKYYEACGFLWLFQCSRYRSELSTCYSTCYYSDCCTGYMGYWCNTPICSKSCLSNAYCSSPETCSCYSGYQMLYDGRTCEDINECSTGTAGCQHGCTNTLGSYQCTCNPGYELAYGKYCYDIDECSRGTSGCANICTNSAGSFTCSCPAGFQLDINGRTCSDIDECTTGTADCGGFCMNTYGSYTCSCDNGFQLAAVGETCLDVNECLVNNGGCDHTCINLQGTYYCKCQDGYMLTDDGNCADIDECTRDSSSCSQHCQNTEGSYVCSCNQGFQLQSDNKTCSDVDNCVGVVCENGGTCTDGVNSYSCACQPGFTSDHCQSDINECQTLNGECQEACINTNGSFYCACYDGKNMGADGKTCSPNTNGNVDCDSFALGYLPKACFPLPLAICTSGLDHSLKLTSTSQWYRKQSDLSLYYTHGITFINVNDLSLPVSLQGVEVLMTKGKFNLSHGVTYTSGDGEVYASTDTQTCSEFKLVESDIFVYISCGAFFRTFLTSLIPSLPDWISFGKASDSVLSVQDLKTDLIWGREVDGIGSCSGAPVLEDSVYSVFRFESTFNLSFLGQEIRLPKPLSGRKFCFIVDICQSNGETMFLMVPEDSRNLLESIEFFKDLKEERGIQVLPRGIGLSLDHGIKVKTRSTALQLWNGDTLFEYAIAKQGNVWIGGELALDGGFWVVDGSVDVFVRVPKIENLLTSIFYDEWNAYISASVQLKLMFDVFGKSYLVVFKRIAEAEMETYMSIGGGDRVWCGEESNPPGIFFWITMDINPFQGIFLLNDWEISVSQKAYAFVTTEPNVEMINLEDTLLDEIDAVKAVIRNITTQIDDTLNKEHIVLRNITVTIVDDIKKTLLELQSEISNSASTGFEDKKKLFEDLWTLTVRLEKHLRDFSRETENNALDIITTFKTMVDSEKNSMKNIVAKALKKITKRLITFQLPFSGFGLKYRVKLVILGLELGDFEIEVVSSTDSLFRCSRFAHILEHFKGESAVRILGRAFESFQLNRFISYEKGIGIGGALSKVSNKFSIQLQIFANMLGIKGTADLFVTNKGLYLFLEGNIWDIFLAQLDISAETGKRWHDITLKVAGRFLAKAKRKRQIQTVSKSFQASYLDGLKKAIHYIADAANSRLTQVQNKLNDAQNAFTKAQNWLQEKQTDVRNANAKFDQAVAKLKSAKDALERAKGPFQEAMRKLEEAQKNVDNLCKLKTCNNICIPGLKLDICGSWLKYPCFKWTSCMLSIPDLFCEAANLLCKAVRGVAYLALEAAKIFVRIPILALDVAKAAVTAAQIIVDNSRVALTVVGGILEIAKAGLEFAKGVLEAAKLVVEGVKLAIGAAAYVLDFVITYTIQNIIDVRNCGFEIELSTKDLPIFEVFCEVNAFKLGWRKITFTINFKNILQSIWNVARATIESLMKLIGNVVGRKRREVAFKSAHKVHEILRAIRSADNSTDPPVFIYESINLANSTFGFKYDTDTDYEHRVLLFKGKCEKTKRVFEFLELAFISLQNVANKSLQAVREIESQISELEKLTTANLADSMTVEDAGISQEYAFNDYNMTEEDLQAAVNQSKADLAENPVISAINEAINTSIANLEAELASIYAVDFREAWLLELTNVSLNYFNTSECVGFQDCVLYATSILYEVYEDVDIPEIENIQQTLLDVEVEFFALFQNETSTIPETASSIDTISTHVNYLAETDPFCSKAPYFNSYQEDLTVLVGTDVSLLCDASGEPSPAFWWFKDDNLLEDENSDELVISNVTVNNTGRYFCMAGNIVANISSEEAFLLVLTHDDDECLINNGGCEHECENTIGSFKCYCETGYTLNDDRKTCSDGLDEEEVFSNSIVIGVSLGALVLVLVTVGGIFMYLRFGKPQKIQAHDLKDTGRKVPLEEPTSVIEFEQEPGPSKTVFSVHHFQQGSHSPPDIYSPNE